MIPSFSRISLLISLSFASRSLVARVSDVLIFLSEIRDFRVVLLPQIRDFLILRVSQNVPALSEIVVQVSRFLLRVP